VELRLDNELWKDALPAAYTIDWPKDDDFFSLRMFMVIHGGLDLRRAAGLIAVDPAARDEQLEASLTAAGFSRIEAKRIGIIIPMAFGQVLLGNIVPMPTQCTVDDGRSVRLVDLDASPLYQQAVSFARQALDEGMMAGEEYVALALRNPNARALNDLLNTGSEEQEIRVIPPTILWHEDEPLFSAGP
jgi:hypothetical protein